MMAVRMPIEKCEWENDIVRDDSVPELNTLNWKCVGESIEIPGVPPTPEFVACDQCDGDGKCCCRCGDEHKCGGCDGTGKIGAKHETVVLSDNTKVSNIFLLKLIRFGVTHVYHTNLDRRFETALIFRVGDIEGLLMPRAE